MKTKILLVVIGFSIFIMADGKSLFHFSLSRTMGRSENQGVHVDPRKPIWLKDIPKPKQGSKGNQIFRKIIESMKTLIKEKNESPTPAVSELKRNQTSVRLTKSCHFDKIEKCTNLEWLEFWNSKNSIPQPSGSNKTPMIEKESQNQENQENQAKTTELTKDQMTKSNLIQISSKTEKEPINLHSKVPLELTRDQIHRVKICNFDKFELCTREEWYKFIKGNQEPSKGQVGSGQSSWTEKEQINLPSKSLSELTTERERKLQLMHWISIDKRLESHRQDL